MPLLSIIVPTRNEARNIPACLSAVQWSLHAGLCETIVVDNHSEDGTADLARAAGARVFLQGPERSAQRNCGARHALSGYLLFLDADMRLPEDTLREILDTLSSPTPPDGLYVPEVRSGCGWWVRVRNFERSFYDGTCIDALRVMRRELFLEVNGYDESLYAGEDWDLDHRFLSRTNRTILIRGHLVHDEGRFTLARHLRKKRYYSSNLDRYRAKWPGDAVVRRQFSVVYRLLTIFLENGKWRRSLRRPDLLFGIWLDRVLVGMQYAWIFLAGRWKGGAGNPARGA